MLISTSTAKRSGIYITCTPSPMLHYSFGLKINFDSLTLLNIFHLAYLCYFSPSTHPSPAQSIITNYYYRLCIIGLAAGLSFSWLLASVCYFFFLCAFACVGRIAKTDINTPRGQEKRLDLWVVFGWTLFNITILAADAIIIVLCLLGGPISWFSKCSVPHRHSERTPFMLVGG